MYKYEINLCIKDLQAAYWEAQSATLPFKPIKLLQNIQAVLKAHISVSDELDSCYRLSGCTDMYFQLRNPIQEY